MINTFFYLYIYYLLSLYIFIYIFIYNERKEKETCTVGIHCEIHTIYQWTCLLTRALLHSMPLQTTLAVVVSFYLLFYLCRMNKLCHAIV
ncbi:hypothetical protein BDF14DRAFT_800221 [Spinellus fusiger]|nr:hypothetical protein BDF14DRAFT_800221 [Spinellus fusiger]